VRATNQDTITGAYFEEISIPLPLPMSEQAGKKPLNNVHDATSGRSHDATSSLDYEHFYIYNTVGQLCVEGGENEFLPARNTLSPGIYVLVTQNAELGSRRVSKFFITK
jgi:hypothetical protein